MFVDKVAAMVQAGDGGNGHLSFRHEKFIDRGGPDGGDGGNGGDVIMVASRNQNTLANFRFQKVVKAESGRAGDKQRMHGKSGKDLVLKVPVGTVVTDENGVVIADLSADDQRAIIAKGGRGGFGNAHFVSSTRQAPRIAEKGELGERLPLMLELKMIADVGIVGLPNAGKSTLLAHVSNAQPEIANYPFTTIRPNLGVVDIDETMSLLFADIPGLIEGASLGKGLGDEFLRHIERTKMLVHMIDAYDDKVASSYKTIQKELHDYRIDLTLLPQIVALNKVDGMEEKFIIKKLSELQKVVPPETILMAVSASSGLNITKLLFEVKGMMNTLTSAAEAEALANPVLPVIRLEEDPDRWTIEESEDGELRVIGKKIERFAARTDFSSAPGVQRLRDIMRKMGIMNELKRRGVEPGRKIAIGRHGKVEY